MPEVSVIIPIYNTAAYLRKALDSICDQTLKELEIILIDDGSTDGSRGIIEEYAERDARIRWHAQPNQGQGVARNTALALATGRYSWTSLSSMPKPSWKTATRRTSTITAEKASWMKTSCGTASSCWTSR